MPVTRRRRPQRTQRAKTEEERGSGGSGSAQAGEDTRVVPVHPTHLASQPLPPAHRLLRGYSFDPRLAKTLQTALLSEITYKIRWEETLAPGPIGEYIEVVDCDPGSACFYSPVDLNHPHLLAQNGLAPSEGSPQFHQQMVYAVAMTTIDRFERALGRKALWADHYDEENRAPDDEYVQRLRIYPHALRMANAYYSRSKGALLCGYFPATDDYSSGEFPGGMVFTCLSHDVISHEITHALLDGFHEHFMEATNPDVLAFHEAFADIVALLQHFSFPEVLVHQIGQTRGDLRSENLLAQLASQVGHARGAHGALRDAIGGYDEAEKKWVRLKADPSQLERTYEVHARGAILVAAVFDAFLSIYQARARDLMRVASGGTGILPEGDLHPDLVARLAQDAAKCAGHVLNMCIRALEYCPPVDITFGEYLRALITADLDLMPEDAHGYRLAFVEAFRHRGIYPRDVRTLSEDSLRWERPGEDPTMAPGEMEEELRLFLEAIRLRERIDTLRYKQERREIWSETRRIRGDLHDVIQDAVTKAKVLEQITGLALSGYKVPAGVKVWGDGTPVFSVRSLREARRQREDGRILNQVFITILQTETMEHALQKHKVRCGSTLVIDLDEMRVTYVIRKGRHDMKRLERTIRYKERQQRAAGLRETYFGEIREVFAALHGVGI